MGALGGGEEEESGQTRGPQQGFHSCSCGRDQLAAVLLRLRVG